MPQLWNRAIILFLCASVAAAGETSTDLIPFRAADGKWGFTTPSKEPVSVSSQNGSKRDEIVIAAQYAWVGFFRNGLARVTKEGHFEPRAAEVSDPKWGFIGPTGREVIPMQFTQADDFCGDHAIVEVNNSYGLIDKTGAFVIPARYKSIHYFMENRARVSTDAGVGFCDLTGAEIVPLRYENADQFNNGMARVCRESKFAWIDIYGNEIAFGMFDHIENFSEQLAAFQKDGKWGFADIQGDVVIAAAWDAVHQFYQGLAAVKRGTKWGYVDKFGTVVIQPSFDSPGDFDRSGFAVVGIEKEYAFIRRDGSFAFPQRFAIANPFQNGVASVIFEKRRYHLDLSGTMKPKTEFTRQWMNMNSQPGPSNGLDFFLMYENGGNHPW